MSQISVLIIEDEISKMKAVSNEVSSFFNGNVEITFGETFGEATRHIAGQRFDLIVIDLLLPRRKDDEPTDVSGEMVEHILESDLNRSATVVAVSQFGKLVEKMQKEFSSAAIFLVHYDDTDQWKSCLQICMQKVSFKDVYDFLVVCALEKERTAYQAVNHPDFEYGDLFKKDGLDCRELKVGPYSGVCVLQPRMGLVDASIVTTKAINTFDPKLVCMSGICGGFEDEVEFGTLLVSDITWEYQAGKQKGDEFEIRGFHESVCNELRIVLSQQIESDPSLRNLASKNGQIPVPHQLAKICPTVSGSAVIASSRYAAEIKKQHGKVAGVDMEVFGIFRSAALHGDGLKCFAAKTVVDFADEVKNDDIQIAGAILSARFVIEAIPRALQS